MAPLPTKKRLPLDPDVLTQELSELGDLTPRQEQVIRLIVMGQTLPQIGIRLGLSTRTVKFYRNAAFQRLGVRSTGELWAMLFEYGGHLLKPLDEYPIDWPRLLKTIDPGVRVTVARIMRMSGRSKRVVVRELRKQGFVVE